MLKQLVIKEEEAIQYGTIWRANTNWQ